MTQHFRRHIATFLLLHLIFAILLLTGYKLFTDLTVETFSYLFWFIIIFGVLATFVQSFIFTFVLSKVRLNRLLIFVIAFIIELLLVNALVVYVNRGDRLTGDLVNDIKHHNTWENLSGSLIIHVALVLSTVITSVTRPIYKKVAV
jgi:hypothetical protein